MGVSTGRGEESDEDDVRRNNIKVEFVKSQLNDSDSEEVVENHSNNEFSSGESNAFSNIQSADEKGDEIVLKVGQVFGIVQEVRESLRDYTIKVAIVEFKCGDSWRWFLEILEGGSGQGNDDKPWTLMSDKQKGLKETIKVFFKYIP
ncbi:hypothetical protein GH714_021411 [Hevea brasiliensis]|uniref:Uncharacterized protein n=1 Tax=Hevea brasiliensis TaxID=3981 RepID=A0A6A6MZ03_HEVBR|nr:hypothetical protein GH714_021411 [Hevea brasiliensis]